MIQDSELRTAVEQLCEPWEMVFSPQETGRPGYTVIPQQPLLDMLYNARRSSTGRTGSGRSEASSRNLIDLAAFELWEHIDGGTRSWIRELSKERPSRELKSAVSQLATMADTLYRSGGLDEPTFTRLSSMVVKWKASIDLYFDPPVVKELQAPCPRCAHTDYFDAAGLKSTAVILTYSRGQSPVGHCRRCLRRWEGDRELLELGFSVRATMDLDALREMGVSAA